MASAVCPVSCQPSCYRLHKCLHNIYLASVIRGSYLESQRNKAPGILLGCCTAAYYTSCTPICLQYFNNWSVPRGGPPCYPAVRKKERAQWRALRLCLVTSEADTLACFTGRTTCLVVLRAEWDLQISLVYGTPRVPLPSSCCNSRILIRHHARTRKYWVEANPITTRHIIIHCRQYWLRTLGTVRDSPCNYVVASNHSGLNKSTIPRAAVGPCPLENAEIPEYCGT